MKQPWKTGCSPLKQSILKVLGNFVSTAILRMNKNSISQTLWKAPCLHKIFSRKANSCHMQSTCKTHVKLITNRWAWALVPSKLVEPGNALAWGGGIHGNPASGPHQAPSHWTIQWNTYRPNTYLAHTKREGGMGKTKAQTGRQTASNWNNTLRRTASKQLRI